MLAGLITPRRLERGLFSSASQQGKATIVCCGAPCFACWTMMIGTAFVAGINTHYVLNQESRHVLEVPCSSPADASRRFDALHHIEGCPFNRKLVNNSWEFTVGSFKWDPEGPCGTFTEKMKKGELLPDSPVSFLGNASGGMLKTWKKHDATICGFMQGEASAPIMVQNVQGEETAGWLIVLVSCFCFLSWSSCCLFFPDDLGENSSDRATCLAFLAGVMSAFCFTLSYIWGDLGLAVGGIIILLVLVAGFDDDLPKRVKDCFARPEDPASDGSDGLQDESIAEPLMASSQQPARDYSSTDQTSAPVQEVRNDADALLDPDLESHLETKTPEGNAETLAGAICIGLAAGLLVGLILSTLFAVLRS